jgi:hypothetical protein
MKRHSPGTLTSLRSAVRPRRGNVGARQASGSDAAQAPGSELTKRPCQLLAVDAISADLA